MGCALGFCPGLSLRTLFCGGSISLEKGPLSAIFRLWASAATTRNSSSRGLFFLQAVLWGKTYKTPSVVRPSLVCRKHFFKGSHSLSHSEVQVNPSTVALSWIHHLSKHGARFSQARVRSHLQFRFFKLEPSTSSLCIKQVQQTYFRNNFPR